MRVVTWNMGCGPNSSYRKSHDEAWRYLLQELRPDVALVQEALVTKKVLGITPRAGSAVDRSSSHPG
jgi:hypothetical protein